MKRHGNGWTTLSLLAILALLALTYAPSFAQGTGPSDFKATPLTPESTIQIAKSASGTSATKLTSVIVKLKGAPLAAYAGGIQGLAPTSPSVIGESQLNVESAASQAYLAHLAQEQAFFIATATRAIPEAKVTYQYDVVLNGVAMIVPADQVDELAKLPSVEAIYADELLQPQTDNSPQFLGAPTIWNQLGGQESSGDNVVVGVIDTGIWPEHPSFSDPDPSGKAFGPPPPPLSGTRLCQFGGGANPGPAFTCNNKLIGAYRYMSTYSELQPVVPGEYSSARDDDGHGTHTASTAAGNGSVQASIFGVSRGIVSGITPRARVIMYKVCGAAGCYESDSVAAVNRAILNGVNVINFSISGGATPYSDPVELAFLNAYSAGVFVAASAGNAGPAPDTTDHRGPWTTTVAASTQNRAFETTATVAGSGGASLALTGTSITAGASPASVLVPASDVQCNNPFAAGSVAGKIVVCQRGNTGRAQKGYNILQGGAAGMILYNQSAAVTDLETDNHYLPAVQIQYARGQSLLTFLAANPGATASWPAGAKVSAQGDAMASFSSRGGPGQTLGVSKPDITAPGVSILAGASPQHMPPPAGVALGPQGESFQAIAGTSMSSPHIAGAGALLKAQHPGWTPGQIKSALMTTAWTQVVKEDGTTPANAFDDGAGRVNLNVAGDPGLTFDESALDYVALQNNLWNANYPSVYVPAMPGAITVQRTAHSILPSASQWKLEVKGKSANDFTITVPPTLVVSAGGDAPFNIDIDGRDVPVGQVRMATLYLTQDGGTRELHMPITFIRKAPVVSLTKSCAPATVPQGAATNCTVTAINNSFDPATVNISDQLPAGLTLVPGSVKGGLPSGNGVNAFGTLDGAQPPDVSIGPGPTPAGYLPLSQFGIAPISGVGDETITNYTVPAFTYAGETYASIGIVSNGYAVVGGGTSADIQYINQSLPNPTPPNNVLASFWTDLDPGKAGAMRIAILTDGVNDWIVLEWEGVREYGSAANLHSFQIWVGVSANTPAGQDISFAYGPNKGNGDLGFATVGAENKFGNRGANYYVDGTGTLPVNGTQLRVTATPPAPGGKAVITYAAQADQMGDWTNYAELTSDLFQGTSIARAAGTTVAPAPDVWVKKSGPATAKVGDVVTYTVTLGNSGSAPAIGVAVTDTLFAGATPVAQMNMVLPIVPAGYITTVVQAVPVQPALAGVTLTNRIEASAVGDIDLTNNQAEAQTVVVPLVAATQTFAGAKDTFLEAGQPTTNFGAWSFLYVGANDTVRSVIGFDLSALQPWYPVDKATLSVYIESYSGGGSPAQLAVYEVIKGWAENTATWKTPWIVPGGDYISAAVAGTPIEKTAVGTWKKFDVTPLVQKWVANPATNQGAIMRLVNATSYTLYRLPSRQYWTPANMPMLEVTYRKP